MKNILLISLFCFFVISNSKAQILKVAILDFENTSGIAKYDGLGKAMSSMLITDIESNVSPKRLQLVERAQIQKILKEQNFQSSSAVDKTTTVKAGKILGVKYLLVGDIYILNDVLVINARLTDTETGDIKFSKKQEGKLSTWLMLKTNIAKELALSISMPFTEPNIPDKEMNVATITTFGNAVVAKDEGKIEKAEELLNTVQEFSPDFKYLDDLKNEIKELKNRLEKVEQDLEITTTDPISAAQNFDKLGNFTEAEKYYQIGLKRLNKNELGNFLLYNFLLSDLCYKYHNYEKALNYCQNILDVYFLFDGAVKMKTELLQKLNRHQEYIDWTKKLIEQGFDKDEHELFYAELLNYKIKNKIAETDNDGIYILNYGPYFSLEVADYSFKIFDKRVKNKILDEFLEINTNLNGLASTSTFLKNLKSSLTCNKYYKCDGNNYEVNYWYSIITQKEGWVYLLNKDVTNARERFGKSIYFQVKELSEKTISNFILAIQNKDSVSILDNTIRKIFEDKNGNLWFVTGSGLSKYDRKSFINFPDNNLLVSDDITCILEDKSGNIWFGKGSGISKYDGKSFNNITDNEGILNDGITCILEDKSGYIWFGTHKNGLLKYDGKSFSNFTKKEGLTSNNIMCILEDKSENIWFGTDKGISKYDRKSFSSLNFSALPLFIFEDRNENVWFRDWTRLIKYNSKSLNKFEIEDNSYFDRYSYVNILQDNNGNIWFGTNNGTISMYNGKTIINYADSNYFLNNKVLTFLLDKKGKIWIGTESGVINFNGSTFKETLDYKILGNKITFLFEDKYENIWIGTEGNGVMKYDGKSFTKYAKNELLSNDEVIGFLDSLSIIYNGGKKILFLDLLLSSNDKYESGSFCRSVLKYGHTFLLEGNISEAQKTYDHFDSNYIIQYWNERLSVKQMIQNDLSEFVSIGILSKEIMDKVLKNLK